jgi:hypothetical protein
VVRDIATGSLIDPLLDVGAAVAPPLCKINRLSEREMRGKNLPQITDRDA